MISKVSINYLDHNIKCRIPKGTVINGDFKSTSGVLLEGQISGGSVQVSGGTFVVMENAIVRGRLHVVGDLYVKGEVECSTAVVEGTMYLAGTSRFKGECRANAFETYAGAIVQGALKRRGFDD